MKLATFCILLAQLFLVTINEAAEAPIENSKVEPSEISSVIENQLKALRSKDLNAAYKNFTTKNFQNTTSFDEYQKIVQSNKPLNENKLFKYDSFYVENGVVTFAGELVATDGSFIRVEFDVVKEENSWKINGMQLFQFEQTISPR